MTRKPITMPHLPTKPALQTLCTRCKFRYDFAHDCLSCEQERIETPIGLQVIMQCSGFVPAAVIEAVAA